MKKRCFKKVISFFTAIIIALSVYTPITTVKAQESGISALWVNPGGGTGLKIDSIKWYELWNGYYLLALPSYTDFNNLSINYTASDKVYIGGQAVTNGAKYIKLSSGSEYIVTCDGKSYTLFVFKSSKVPAFHITTQSGSLDYIHASKSNKEPGNAKLVTADGKVNCESQLKQIKGRGNASWYNFEKKSYNIKFNEKQDLLGMGASKDWSLIGNPTDASGVRNKLAYTIGEAGGIEFCSDLETVDLYINNEYRGAFALTEKLKVGDTSVDITDLEKATEKVNSLSLDSYARKGENRAIDGTKKWVDIPNNPSDITGGYLLEVDLVERYADEVSGFTTTNGAPMVIKSPEYASKAQVDYISQFFQDMEDAVYSSTGYNSKGKHYSEYIDIASFAKMYILQEISANLDVCITSFFIYKESDLKGDGKLHAAPPWDFDNAFGNSSGRFGYNLGDYNVNWTENGYIDIGASPNKGSKPHLFNKLYKQNDKMLMYEVMYQWSNGFKDATLKQVNETKSYYDKIRASLVMDCYRWRKNINEPINGVQYVMKYIENRIPYFTQKYASMKNANGFIIEGLKDSYVYYGKPITPTITVKDGYGNLLKEGTNYTITYKNNNGEGTASIVITGKGGYTGSREHRYNIVTADFSNVSINEISSEYYTGKAIKPKITLTGDYSDLIEGVDYTVSYKNNVNAGTATVTLTGKNVYTGSKIFEFKILPRNISQASFKKLSNQAYTGKNITPNTKVSYNGVNLVKNKDYTVSYKNNKKMGKAEVTIKGKGNFTGTKKLYFNIVPKKVNGIKLSAEKGVITVYFKKLDGVKNYQVQYSLNKSFKNAKTVNVKSSNKTKLSKLKKGKLYYIRVRGVYGKLYGDYSSVIKIRSK